LTYILVQHVHAWLVSLQISLHEFLTRSNVGGVVSVGTVVFGGAVLPFLFCLHRRRPVTIEMELFKNNDTNRRRLRRPYNKRRRRPREDESPLLSHSIAPFSILNEKQMHTQMMREHPVSQIERISGAVWKRAPQYDGFLLSPNPRRECTHRKNL